MIEMQKLYQNRVCISIILFIFSFAILSFNLSEQGPHQDEIDFFYAYSLVYYDLIKKGDFFHPCWNGSGECEELSVIGCDRIEHWVTTHGFVKHLLIGIGVSALEGNNNPDNYSPMPPLCKPSKDPIPGINVPTKDELSSARFFSVVLSSLSIVLAYFIGKILFNRSVGFIFSLLLLFSSLWFAYSRTIMTEPFIYFFMLLSFFLLLYSLKQKNKIRYVLLVSSAIIFGIAFDTKAIVFMFFPLFILTIFLRNSINEKLTKISFNKKRYFSKSIIISLFYTLIIFIAIIGTLPFYWIGPYEQIIFQKESLNAYTDTFSLKLPGETDSQFVGFLSTITVTIVPIIDVYYEFFSTEETPESVSRANNFSSVPLSILFLTGVGYLIYSIKTKGITGSEVLILFWATSMYILLSLMVESYSTSRFFIMMFLPVLLVASYGYYRFFTTIQNKKLQIFSFLSLISAHAITTLIFWDRLFYQPDMIWSDPLMIRSQEAIMSVEVLLLSLIFSVFFIILGIKKIKDSKTINF
tara:strand:- start:272 stop:1843 length:1572 start_codon:yes stop_codon:yes gene_type:complete